MFGIGKKTSVFQTAKIGLIAQRSSKNAKKKTNFVVK